MRPVPICNKTAPFCNNLKKIVNSVQAGKGSYFFSNFHNSKNTKATNTKLCDFKEICSGSDKWKMILNYPIPDVILMHILLWQKLQEN